MFRGFVRNGLVIGRTLQSSTSQCQQSSRLFSSGLVCRQQDQLGDKESQPNTAKSTEGIVSDDDKTKGAPILQPSSTSFMKELADIDSTVSNLATPSPGASTSVKTNLWDTILTGLENMQPFPSSNAEPRIEVKTSEVQQIAELQFEELWRHRQARGPIRPAKPSDGRVVTIQGDGDVARAYGILNALLSKNNVRHELRLGERYEKPNQLRRRLKSERHRRRFADAVRQKVKLVMELKSRGA